MPITYVNQIAGQTAASLALNQAAGKNSANALSSGKKGALNSVANEFLGNTLRDKTKILTTVTDTISYTKHLLKTAEGALGKLGPVITDMINTVAQAQAATGEDNKAIDNGILQKQLAQAKELIANTEFDGIKLFARTAPAAPAVPYTQNVRTGVNFNQVVTVEIHELRDEDIFTRPNPLPPGPRIHVPVFNISGAPIPGGGIADNTLNVQEALQHGLKMVRTEEALVRAQLENLDISEKSLRNTTGITEEAATSYTDADFVEMANRFVEDISRIMGAISVVQAFRNKLDNAIQMVLQGLVR